MLEERRITNQIVDNELNEEYNIESIIIVIVINHLVRFITIAVYLKEDPSLTGMFEAIFGKEKYHVCVVESHPTK